MQSLYDVEPVNKHANPSVTLLVSQPLMSPYVAAAVVGSLHHALTAVPMLAFVMAVVSRRLAITNTERAARRLSLPSPNGNLVAAPVVCEKEAKRERERKKKKRKEKKAATCEYACFVIERKSLMIGRITATGH